MCKNCNTRRPAMYTMVLEHQNACMELAERDVALHEAGQMFRKPENKAPKAPAASTPAAKAPGDWTCLKCGNNNFASSFMCFCGAPRPTSKTEGGASSSEKPATKQSTTAPSKEKAAPAKEKP